MNKNTTKNQKPTARRIGKIDLDVGKNIKILRLSIGMSRRALSDQIGVTHQQIHKYENGVNRVSPQRLNDIAALFNRPIGYFFDQPSEKELEIDKNENINISDDILKEGQSLCMNTMQSFSNIKSLRVRRAISKLVEVISETQNNGESYE